MDVVIFFFDVENLWQGVFSKTEMVSKKSDIQNLKFS